MVLIERGGGVCRPPRKQQLPVIKSGSSRQFAYIKGGGGWGWSLTFGGSGRVLLCDLVTAVSSGDHECLSGVGDLHPGGGGGAEHASAEFTPLCAEEDETAPPRHGPLQETH